MGVLRGLSVNGEHVRKCGKIKQEELTMSQFAKRHYEALATVIQETIKHRTTSSEQVAAVYEVAKELEILFRRDNSLFKSARFMAACVPGTNVRART
jgi:hypothetical protein